MDKPRILFYPLFGLVLIVCSSSYSHQGSDFYFGILKNQYGPESIQLIVGTTGKNSSIAVPFKVEDSIGTVLYSGSTTSELPTTVNISVSYQVENSSFSERRKGIHVYAEDGSDLSTIVVNHEAHTTGEYIIYPCHELPVQRYTYYVVSVPTLTGFSDHNGQAVLTGCENDTIITVIPTINIIIPSDTQNPSSENIVLTAGTAHTFVLHQLQTLAFDSGYSLGDLTGTQITSDKPLTVITGHNCGFIPDDVCCCEHFGGQIPPSTTWGENFILLPYRGRIADTYFKVVTSEVNTSLIVACNSTPSSFSIQANGEHVEFSIEYTQYCSLVSNKPVLVAQFAPGGNLDGGLGDVVMSIVPPIEQYTNKVTVTPLSDILYIDGHYVNIFVTNNKTVYLGEEQLLEWEPVYDSNGQIFGYGLQEQVTSDMIHTVHHSDVSMGVGVISYGFGFYTGYSYTGGTEIKSLKPEKLVISPWYGNKFGGVPILISGPSFKENDVLHCIFDGTMVEAVYISEEYASCVSPRLLQSTRVIFNLMINSILFDDDAIFYPLSLEDSGDITIQADTLLFQKGDSISVAWNPLDISRSVGNVVNMASIKVDIKLIKIDQSTDEHKELAILASDIPNSGFAIINFEGELDLSSTELSQVSLFVEAKFHTDPVKRSITKLLFKAGLWTSLFYLTSSGIGQALCEHWASTEPTSVGQEVLERVRSVFPCPPTADQAWNENSNLQHDNRLIWFFHPDAKNCFRQRDGTEARTGGHGNQCCYDKKNELIVGPGSGGTVDKVAPSKSTWEHFKEDVIPYLLCCKGLFKNCQKYYDRRPSDDGSAFTPPIPAWWFGDPHIVTLDLHKYTFNGKGEFVLMETTDNSFTVHGRMVEAMNSDGETVPATVFSAIVAKQNESDTVQFELFYNELIVVVNGQRIEFNEVVKEQMFNNVSVANMGNGTLTATFSRGEFIKLVEENGILSVMVLTLPKSYVGLTRGLMGSYDGDTTNDLVPRYQSTPLPLNSTLQSIHEDFGLSWIINNSNDSLFSYLTGQDWITFYHPEFIPEYETIFNDSVLEAEARDLCGDDEFCLFDVAATGRLDIGESTLQGGLNLIRLIELSKPVFCNPPCVHGACVANDTCSCSEGHTGDLCDTVVYSECETNICENGGECRSNAGTYTCICTSGYTGEYCEESEKSDSNIVTVATVVCSVVFVVIIAFIAIVLVAVFAVRKYNLHKV